MTLPMLSRSVWVLVKEKFQIIADNSISRPKFPSRNILEIESNPANN